MPEQAFYLAVGLVVINTVPQVFQKSPNYF